LFLSLFRIILRAVIEERLQILLDAGIDVDWFDGCARDELRAYLGNLQAHRCRLDAVEANVVLALNRVDKKTAPKARPSDNAHDVRDETGKSNAEANRTTRRAELFDRWPAVSAALAEGEITSGHADLLTGIPSKYHEALTIDLAQLLVIAANESVDEFRETLAAWKDATAKAAGDDPHKQRCEARSCSIRKDKDGMVRLNATMHPEAGAKVRNAVTEIAQDLLREDQVDDITTERSHNQRMADALEMLAERATSGGAAEGPSRREPTVVVTVGLEDLKAGLDGAVLGAGPLPAETIRKLACEAGILPAVLDGNGAVLDLGRRTRLASGPQRLALQTRYGAECAVPGCDRPFEWCHIHHIEHWEHGGATDLDNLIPVCSRHHTQIHDGRLHIERTGGADHWHRKPPDQSGNGRGGPIRTIARC